VHFLKEIRTWVGEIIEFFLLLVAFRMIAEVLFGSRVPFSGEIVAYPIGLVGILGESGLVGLIALGITVLLFNRRKAVSSEN
jgi:hypothetical protein